MFSPRDVKRERESFLPNFSRRVLKGTNNATNHEERAAQKSVCGSFFMREFRALCVLRVACDAFCSLPVARFAKKIRDFSKFLSSSFFFSCFSQKQYTHYFLERRCAPFESRAVLENIDVVRITERLSSAPVIERATFVYVFDFSRGGRFNR